jgi:hypothetical protein
VKSGIPGMETIVDAPSKIPDLGHDDATFWPFKSWFQDNC